MTFTHKYTAIVPAAGKGTRMGANEPKQYLQIYNKPIISYCLDTFITSPIIDKVVVVISADDRQFAKLPQAKNPKIATVIGGKERADSVLAGVRYAHETLNSEWVLVHDAARPGLSQKALARLISTVHESEGGILAMPAIDTIKQAKLNQIDKTIDRQHIWLAQTPQMFKSAALVQALKMAQQHQLVLTDEASAMEMQGYQVRLVEGEKANFKITSKDDLALAEFYLHHKKEKTS